MDAMKENGWKFSNISTDEQSCMIEDSNALAECNSSLSWYGWGCQSSSGMLKATLNGSGIMIIRYGNCFEGGTVQVYVNDTLEDETPSHRYNEVSFEYDEGTTVSIVDYDDNAAIKLISVSFACKGKYSVFATNIVQLIGLI